MLPLSCSVMSRQCQSLVELPYIECLSVAGGSQIPDLKTPSTCVRFVRDLPWLGACLLRLVILLSLHVFPVQAHRPKVYSHRPLGRHVRRWLRAGRSSAAQMQPSQYVLSPLSAGHGGWE